MINQSIPRSEDEESFYQEGRLQSVAVMTESLRFDVSTMQMNIKSNNGTIDLLLERGVADRERKVMVAKITEQDVRIGDLNRTIAVQGVRIAELDVRIAKLDVRIASLSWLCAVNALTRLVLQPGKTLLTAFNTCGIYSAGSGANCIRLVTGVSVKLMHCLTLHD